MSQTALPVVAPPRTHASRSRASRTLVEVLPAGRVRTVAAVLLGAATVALVGQVSVPLWFTPVPLTLGTLSVLAVGAALGPRLAVASIALYAVAGMAGVPVFAGGATGVAFASFGYVLGYLPAAWLMGRVARAGADRSVWRTFLGAAAASALVYAVGAPWLAVFLGLDAEQALALGVTPFLLGDAIKAAIVAGVLPTLWRFQRWASERKQA